MGARICEDAHVLWKSSNINGRYIQVDKIGWCTAYSSSTQGGMDFVVSSSSSMCSI